MGCVCTEPRKKPTDFDIWKDSGKRGEENSVKKNSSTEAPHIWNSLLMETSDSISPNEQKLRNCSPEKVSFTKCATPVRNQGIESANKLLKQYSVDSASELSDLPSAKSIKTNWLITKTTSNIYDISLVIQREVALVKCIPEEGTSPLMEQNRVVLPEESLPNLPALESAEISTVELRKVRKKLDQMKSRNIQMDEEIENLKAENCKLKENAKRKAVCISKRNSILRERACSMRKRRTEIRESTIFNMKMLTEINHSPSNESNTAEMESSFELLPDIQDILALPELESSQHLQFLRQKSLKTESSAVTSSNWSVSETMLI